MVEFVDGRLYHMLTLINQFYHFYTHFALCPSSSFLYKVKGHRKYIKDNDLVRSVAKAAVHHTNTSLLSFWVCPFRLRLLHYTMKSESSLLALTEAN